MTTHRNLRWGNCACSSGVSSNGLINRRSQVRILPGALFLVREYISNIFISMKKCFQCIEIKDYSLFYKNKSTKDGHSGICKECQLKNERENNLKVKEWIISLKNKCCKCGENRHWVLDFHHTDPSKKNFNISEYSISGTTSFKTKKMKIENELKNCVLLCSNCHRDFHYCEKLNGIDIQKYLKL